MPLRIGGHCCRWPRAQPAHALCCLPCLPACPAIPLVPDLGWKIRLGTDAGEVEQASDLHPKLAVRTLLRLPAPCCSAGDCRMQGLRCCRPASRPRAPLR